MITIPDKFSKNGYNYQLVSRLGNVAIYEQSKPDRIYAYEVVKIRVRPPRSFMGKDYPEAEKLPSDEEWGPYGKTFSTYGASESSTIEARRAAKAQMDLWVADGERKASLPTRSAKQHL